MDKSSLKISIITVCFNASNTIEETIISVVKQTYKNIEYIIIDGGSSDQTNNIIDKYSEFISYYCSEPDDGIYDAMNKGLEYVTGDYVLFLGADDHLISYSVIEQVCNKILLYNEEKVFYGDVFRPILNDIYCNRFTKIKLAVKNIPHQGVFYPRCVYKRYKYDLKYNLFADYYYNISLFSRIGFEYLGLTISYFNDLGSSARLNDLNFEKDEKKIKISKLGYLPFLYSELYHFLRNLIKKMKISVCLATFNGEKYLQQQIESILIQLGDNDELIISDDGSSDQTLNIIESFSDKRIHIFHNKMNHGFIGNFENALRIATGDYIFLSDQDDVWSSDKLRISLQALEKADLIVHDAEMIDGMGNSLGKNYYSMMHSGTGFLRNWLYTRFLGCCMAFNRKVLNACLPFPKYITGHDYWIGMYALLKFRVRFIPERLVYYRRHGNNVSSSSEKSKNTWAYKIIIKRLGIIWALINK